MLCYIIILQYIILYHITLYYMISYYIISYYLILYYIILYHIILYYSILYYIILYYIILYWGPKARWRAAAEAASSSLREAPENPRRASSMLAPRSPVRPEGMFTKSAFLGHLGLLLQ